jgi:ribose transport system permease protein
MQIGKKIRGLDYARLAPFVALVILFVISAVSSRHFLKPQNLLNILRQVSYTGVIALGMTFVIIAGGIDLSVGSAVALSGAIGLMAVNYCGQGPWALVAGIAVGLIVGGLCGLVNGVLVTLGKVAPFIATLGTMSIYRSLTLYMCQAGEVRSQNEWLSAIGAGDLLGVPVPVWVFLLLVVLLHVVLTRTRYGRYVLAVGANETVARYSAIRVRKVKALTYVLTGLTVGVSALLMASRLNSVSSSNAGHYYELDAIAAVVIGGTMMTGGEGTIYGTVIGAIILGIISNMLNMMDVSTYLQGTVRGAVIIGAVLLQYKKKRE